MIFESKIDLILLRQGLLHVFNFHAQCEKNEKEVIDKFPENKELSSLHFHQFRKERAKKLIFDINFSLDKIATAEKAAS